MSRNYSTIERRYLEHERDDENDGAFCSATKRHYRVEGDFCACRFVVYTTKPSCILARWEKLCAGGPIALIGGYGLPNTTARNWLLKLMAARVCIYLGDADPPDLLIYSSLRRHMEIKWVGVSDNFLEMLGTDLTDKITIPLSGPERRALCDVRELCTDYQDLLGPTCSMLLNADRKLELEGAINFATIDANRWFAT